MEVDNERRAEGNALRRRLKPQPAQVRQTGSQLAGTRPSILRQYSQAMNCFEVPHVVSQKNKLATKAGGAIRRSRSPISLPCLRSLPLSLAKPGKSLRQARGQKPRSRTS